MSDKPIQAYALINARVLPLDRGDQYEDPLIEALAENGFDEVTGAGTMQKESGEIDYCGIDILDEEQGVPFICDFLAGRGAPRGAKLQYDGKEVPFGFLEGLAVYLNGTDLPEKVYEECDINFAYAEISKRLGDRGAIQGYWNGPQDRALYLYGYS